MTVLFVCSQGRIRSRTAEVLSLLGGISARSCGTNEDAVVRINDHLVREATTIIGMERRHSGAAAAFMHAQGKQIESLGIPDEYDPFDPELVALLIGSLRHRLPEVSMAIQRGYERYKANQQDKTPLLTRVA